MGCWNKTCGISNLPIFWGEEVYAFLIEKNTDEKDRCYATSLWKPMFLHFQCEYNDYGAGEKSDKFLPYILEGVKQYMVEMPLGENKFHDIEVSKDGMNERLLFDAVHEGRLKIDRVGEHQLDIVMLRKDIVDDILANYAINQYVGAGKGNCGYDNMYIQYRFADVANEIDDVLDFVIEKTLSHDDIDRFMFSLTSIFESYQRENKNSRLAAYLSDTTYRFCNIVNYNDLILKTLTQGRAEAKDIVYNILRGAFINWYFDQIRKIWAPGCHEGSQSAEYDAYKTLLNAIHTSIDKREQESDEE